LAAEGFNSRDAAAARDRIVEAARAAGRIALAHFTAGQRTPARIDYKVGGSPVTEADLAVDAFLKAELGGAFPDAAWLSEETEDDASRLSRSRLLIVDPIDGTRAFIGNCFLFGSLIALERDDGTGFVPVLGCIAHCAAGTALIGHRGGTTLFCADARQRPVNVRECNRLSDATVLSSSSWVGREQNEAAGIEAVARAAGMYRTWGDCFGYFSLATGGSDVMLDPQLEYWDVSAVVPVVEGAGGRVSSWRGGDPLRDLSLIATAGEVHDEVLRLIAPTGTSALKSWP
jgi:fructose-1,6-bisphosphatase/inositol monophosphatase family enzyme